MVESAFNMKLRYFIIGVLICFSRFTFAQKSTDKDFESWNSFSMNHKLTEQFSIRWNHDLRFDHNMSSVDRVFTDIKTTYIYEKNIYFSIGMRYSHVNDNKGGEREWEPHFRYYIDMAQKGDFNRFEVEARFRYQKSTEINKSIYEGDYPDKNIRGRMLTSYNIKNWKFDPIGSYEMFYRRQIGALNGFDKYRITLGSEYKFDKKWKITIFYFREKEYRIWNPKIINGINLELTYKIPKKEKAAID